MIDRFDEVLDEEVAARSGGHAVADIPAQSAPAESSVDVFASVLDDEVRARDEQSNLSIHAARSIPPEEAAAVLDLSAATGYDPTFVARNRQELEANRRRDDSGFDVVRNSAPVTAAWATRNPYNASLSLEDMRNLAKVEESVQDYGFFRGLGKAFFQTGMLNLAKMGVQAPGGMAEAASGPANLIARMPDETLPQKIGKAAIGAAFLPTPFGQAILTREAMARTSGNEDIELKAPDWMLDNAMTRYIDDKASKTAPWELTASVKESLSKGDYLRAGRILAVNAAASAPTTALILLASAVSGGAGAGVALGGIGAGAAGGKAEEVRAAGAPTAEGQLASLGTGVSEAASEGVGALLPLKSWGNAIANQFGKTVTFETFKAFAKTIAYSAGTEAAEEGINDVAQRLTDWATGVDPKAFGPGWYENTLKKAAVGVFGGAGPSTVMAIPAAVAIRAQSNNIKQTKDFYLALGDSIEASKALARLPQAKKELVGEITKNSPIKDILIPVEAFETYFQGANVDPLGFAQSVDAKESYEAAKENGGYIKIPTASWATVVGTPHYKALADDVKFSADTMTVNESKKLTEEMQKQAAERQPELESVGKVYDDFRSKVQSAGLSVEEANAHAMLMAERAKRRAAILGEDAFDIYQRENIQINAPGTPAALAAMAPGAPLAKAAQTQQQGVALPSDWQTGPARAIFRGWQELDDPAQSYPIYNIIGEHPRQRSTVGAETLQSIGIKVPETPSLQQWKGGGVVTGSQEQTPALPASSEIGSQTVDQGIQQSLPESPGKSPGLPKQTETVPEAQLVSSIESISQHPDFVKMKFDYDAVMEKYAERDAADLSPEYTKKIYWELHDATGALKKATHAKLDDVVDGIMSKYADLGNEWMTVSFMEWAMKSVDSFNSLVAGKYGKYRPKVALEKEAAAAGVPLAETKPKPKVSKKRVKAIAEGMMADAISSYENAEAAYSEWRTLIKNGISDVSRNGQKTDLTGEYELIPLHMKKKDGTFIDDLAVTAMESGLIRDTRDIFDALAKLKAPRRPIRDVAYYMDEAKRIAENETDFEDLGPLPTDEEFFQSAIPNQTAPVFYSQLQSVLEQKMPNAAPVSMIKALIDPAKGNVKAEEVEWSGINEFLAGKDKVTKAELLEFLRGNQVEVKEVVKKDGETERVWGGGTKFSKYQLPGGENYREVLLTLPPTDKKFKVTSAGGPIAKVPAPKEFITREEAEKEISRRKANSEGEFHHVMEYSPSSFHSSHFDEPNILAHVRMNDRTTADGKRVLFLEELQSDWGQANKKALEDITKPQSIGELAEDVFNGKLAAMMPFEVVDGGVLALAKHNQVVEAIVSLLPIDMVNKFGGKEATAKHILGKSSMVGPNFPGNASLAMAQGVLDAARKVGAGLRAKLSAGFKAGRDVELLPALKASDLTPREVVGVLSPKSIYHVGLFGSAGDLNVTGTGAELSSASQEAGVNPNRLSATGAGPSEASRSASKGAEAGGASAWLNAKDFSASVTEMVNWHKKILQQIGSSKQSGYVPGPFVGKTDSWVGLSLKRILRYAVDNGYDGIAWTTGEQQNERYDLSKHVDGVRYSTASEILQAWKGKQNVIEEYNVKPENVVDFVGKEVAQRLLVAPMQAGAFRVLTGDGLKIGGEGMKGFYDQIIPSFLNKYTKKWGGRVGESRIESEPARTGEEPVPTDVIQALKKLDDLGFDYRGRAATAILDHKDFATRWDVPPEEAAIFQKWRDSVLPPSQSVHALDITPSMRESVSKGQPLFQSQQGGDPRAQVRFGQSSINIDLFKGSDLSSLGHELAHVFAREMGQDYEIVKAKDPATLTNEQRQFIQDSENLLKWAGAESFSTLTTEQHEKIARGWEAYMREGKAPSEALKGAFSRFREWLLMIYRAITQLNVELTPEVREVFDRMLASQAEIDAARADMGAAPLFADGKSVGMTDAEADRYAKALAAAKLAGEEELATKVMAEMKRKEMKPYLDRKEEIKAEVTGEVNRRIEYIALSVLQRGALPDGQRVPEGFTPVKLSRKAIVESYGEEHLDLLPKPYVYSRQGGIHPDEAAAIFGFVGGEELLTALENAQPKDQLIDSIVEQRMKAEFGDMRSDGTIATEAMKAVHNNKRSELLKAEMDHLVSDSFAAFKNVVRRVSRPVPSVEAVRQQAIDAIGKMTPRDIYPAMYQRTESKAAREAVESMLKGDMEKAFSAKLKERLNHELYRAAVDARESVDGTVDYFKKFDKTEVRERIGKAGGSYLEQIEGLLDRFDFRKSVTLKELDKRKSLVQWAQEQEAAGFPLDIPQELLNEANRRHYKDTPISLLKSLRETVESIEHLAGLKNKLLANDRARTLDAAIEDITASVTANHTVNNKPVTIEPTLKERFFDTPAEFLASHAKMEFIAEILDGGEKLGPVFRHVIEPLLKAGDAEAGRIHDASNALKGIFDAYTKKERATWYYKKIYIPKLGQTLYKPTILSIALNQGNPYNKEAVIEGLRGLGYTDWTQDHIDAVLDTLDARDIEVVNKIWALLESYWPDASAVEKKVNGIAPAKVVGAPVMVKNGTLNGGYYPIKFDHKRDWVSMKRMEEQLAKGIMGGHWAKSMTKQGHLKERTNTGGKPLRLDLGIINEHIQDVVHDITHRPAVIDVNRIVNDERFRDLMVQTIGMNFYKEFQPWLNSIAGQVNTESISWLESLASHAKKGATVVALGLKMSSGLMQIAGYGNTVKELGEKYALVGLKKMGKNGINLKTLWDEISEKSVEMKYRLSTYDRDVKETMSKLNVTGTKRGILSVPEVYTADLYKAYFGFIGTMDLAMSIPTWLGAYEKAMDGNVKGIAKAEEKDAALYADKVVRMTQSANRVMDLARVQRGNQVQKLFTMFYSQMSIQFNQFMKTGMNIGKPGGKADAIRAFVYMMFAQAVITDLIRGGPGGGDDDESRWFRIAKDMAFIPLETMIVVRDVVSGLERFGYSGSPAFDVGSTLTKAAKAVGSRAFGDKEELTASDWKNIVKSFGYTFALPTGQAWKTAEYLHAWMQGDVEPDNAVQGMWQALVTGIPRENK